MFSPGRPGVNVQSLVAPDCLAAEIKSRLESSFGLLNSQRNQDLLSAVIFSVRANLQIVVSCRYLRCRNPQTQIGSAAVKMAVRNVFHPSVVPIGPEGPHLRPDPSNIRLLRHGHRQRVSPRHRGIVRIQLSTVNFQRNRRRFQLTLAADVHLHRIGDAGPVYVIIPVELIPVKVIIPPHRFIFCDLGIDGMIPVSEAASPQNDAGLSDPVSHLFPVLVASQTDGGRAFGHDLDLQVRRAGPFSQILRRSVHRQCRFTFASGLLNTEKRICVIIFISGGICAHINPVIPLPADHVSRQIQPGPVLVARFPVGTVNRFPIVMIRKIVYLHVNPFRRRVDGKGSGQRLPLCHGTGNPKQIWLGKFSFPLSPDHCHRL